MDHRFVLLGLVLLIAGCGGGGGGGVPAVQAPEITSAAVTPTELTFVGGELNITAEAQAYGGRAIANVTARITGPSVNEAVGLVRDGDQWRGTYTVPANGGGTAVNYVVSITATDDANAGSEAVTRGLTVGGVPAPPPPPVFED